MRRAAFVLRVESLFGAPRAGPAARGRSMRSSTGSSSGREVRVFTDRVVSPSYVDDVAAATSGTWSDPARAPGLYHCVNSGHATWHEVARGSGAAAGRARRGSSPITLDAGGAQGAAAAVLRAGQPEARGGGFAMPAWNDALRRWLAARQTRQR